MNYETTIAWDERQIQIAYCPEYFEDVAHLEIQAVDGELLPITSTGYKSHFFMSDNPPPMNEIISFVTDWLNEDAKSKAWQEHIIASKQMSLF